MNDQPVRNIIITGGNSGMGRATTEAFVKTNAQVAIIGRDKVSVHNCYLWYVACQEDR